MHWMIPPRVDKPTESLPWASGLSSLLINVIRAFPGHQRAKTFQVLLFFHGPDDSEADQLGVGEPPDALRALRIALDPTLLGAAAGGAAKLVRVVRPRPAPGHVRKSSLGRKAHRPEGQFIRRECELEA